MLVVAIGVEYNKGENRSKLDAGLEMKLKVLHKFVLSFSRAHLC